MDEIEEIEIQKIDTMIEKEFPDDPALQQIHIARKIIAKKAELEGLSKKYNSDREAFLREIREKYGTTQKKMR